MHYCQLNEVSIRNNKAPFSGAYFLQFLRGPLKYSSGSYKHNTVKGNPSHTRLSSAQVCRHINEREDFESKFSFFQDSRNGFTPVRPVTNGYPERAAEASSSNVNGASAREAQREAPSRINHPEAGGTL